MNGSRRRFLAATGTAVAGGCSAPVVERGAVDDRERTETTIGFAGDTMLGRDLNGHYGRDDVDPASVWGDLQPRLESLDGVCCNLECCLSRRGDPFPGRTFHFRGDPGWAVPALDAGNVRFASLANNHAMDYGAVALTDTIDALEAAGIDVAGAGESPAAAREPATFSVGAVDVAVVSFADRYVGYSATDDRPGIAHIKPDPADPDTQRIVGEAIERAQANDPDLLVASVHWGQTGSNVPANCSSISATGSSIGASTSFTAIAPTSFRRSSATATESSSTTPATSSTISGSKAIWATTEASSSRSRSRVGVSRRYGSSPSRSTTASLAPARTRRPGSGRRCALGPLRSRRRTNGTATVSSSRCEPFRSRTDERDDPRVYGRSRPTIPRWQGRFPNSRIVR